MEITKDIEIVDLALYLKKHKILIFSDFHIGFEEALNKEGVLVPRFQYKDTIKRLDSIFAELEEKAFNPEKIIINGDVKHEFGTISNQEWRETLKIIDYLSKRCKRLLLVKGNHDTILGPIAKKREIEIVKDLVIDDILIAHGDKIDEARIENKDGKKIKTIIIGHEHPAAVLQHESRTEKFKCFLLGKFMRKKLVVQPSFNLVTEGTDVLGERTLSPFLDQDLKNFECFLVQDGEVLKFGKLKNLQPH